MAAIMFGIMAIGASIITVMGCGGGGSDGCCCFGGGCSNGYTSGQCGIMNGSWSPGKC